MPRPKATMTRAEFLRLTTAAGGAALVGSSASSLLALSPTRASAALGRVSPAARSLADTVLVNGKVATMDSADTLTQAVAVRDGLILDTGSDQSVQALAGPETIVVDLGGRTVTPGFVDPHCHFELKALFGGYLLPFIPPDVTSIVEMQAAIADLVAGMAEDQWVKGFYLYVTEGRYPDRYDLDAVAPFNPVWMMQQGGHWAAANSRALAIAGITSQTPDPPGGVIDRDDHGEPTGVLFNHRAMDLVRAHIPVYGEEELEASILSTQPLFVAHGLTSFQDNNIRLRDAIRTYQTLATDGRMYLRQALFYTLEWPSDLDRALNEIEHVTNDFTRFAGFKFLIDGQGPTFYCHQAHGGERWDMPTWDPDTFKQTVRTLHDTGLQVCVHCGGDAAVDLALDAFEEAMNGNPRPDPRHRLEHAVITTPQATQRMRDLGVVVSTQPQFIRIGGDGYADLFTPEQVERILVTREWVDSGVTVALGSDAPTTPWIEPQATLYGAMTRYTLSDQVIGPDQVLTISQALRGHTIDAAYAVHEEAIKGSLEAGKLADLIVWSADPYTATAEEVYRAAIDLTMVGGEIVYLGPRTPRRHPFG